MSRPRKKRKYTKRQTTAMIVTPADWPTPQPQERVTPFQAADKIQRVLVSFTQQGQRQILQWVNESLGLTQLMLPSSNVEEVHTHGEGRETISPQVCSSSSGRKATLSMVQPTETALKPGQPDSKKRKGRVPGTKRCDACKKFYIPTEGVTECWNCGEAVNETNESRDLIEDDELEEERRQLVKIAQQKRETDNIDVPSLGDRIKADEDSIGESTEEDE